MHIFNFEFYNNSQFPRVRMIEYKGSNVWNVWTDKIDIV